MNISDKAPKDPFQFTDIFEFMEAFPTDAAANAHFAQIRWSGKPVCPHCGHDVVYTYSDGKRYKCKGCKVQFTVKSGTVFEDSNVGMRKWFMAIYLLTNWKKGISSHELGRKIKVTQKTAWFMEQRIRFAFQSESFNAPMKGVIEADETFVGGKEANKHKNKKTPSTQGRSTATKTAVLGLKSRAQGVFAQAVMGDLSGSVVQDFVTANVAKGAILMTDEYSAYAKVSHHYDHRVVTHSAKQYAVGIDNDTHCNGIENYWSHFKRGIIGVHHYISRKHMNLYLAAQSFRYNNCKALDWQRFRMTLGQTSGKRITYKELTKKLETA